jgi:arylsulfatase A-like enzyme
LNCLPRIFNALGYHSLYFFGGSRNARIMRFAQSIGFEKVLADDIVQPNDVKFDWGYREDIFFTRIHEYLQKYYAKDKLFIFIDTGATNHTPFEVLDDSLLSKVPYTHPKNFEEHISNTTFVQDVYFGQLYDIFKKYYAHRGSLLAVSDHSWPIMIHKDNIYNERGAYEENFLIPLLFVPPSSERNHFAVGTTSDSRFSQMDISPTILQLIGMEHRHLLGESFASCLVPSQSGKLSRPQKTKISIQPYGGGFISAVRYPEKYLFDVLGQNVKIYNLEEDPGEQSPDIHDVGNYMPLIRTFFHPESPDR